MTPEGKLARAKKLTIAADRRNAKFKAAIIQHLLQGSSRREAYTVVGIAHETFYSWMEKKPEFKAAVENAESRAVLKIEKVLKRCAAKAEKDPAYQKSMEFFLKSNKPEKYRADEQVTVNNTMPSITFTTPKPPENK